MKFLKHAAVALVLLVGLALLSVPALAADYDLTGAEITLAQSEYVYSGIANEPAVVSVVTAGDETVPSDDYYTVSWSNNTNAGIATATIQGIGVYGGDTCNGEASVSFTISPKPLTITPNSSQGKYFGMADPTLTVDQIALDLQVVVPEVITLTGELGREPGETVGTYDIVIGTLGLDPLNPVNANYTLVMVDPLVTFSISYLDTAPSAELNPDSPDGDNGWYKTPVHIEAPSGYEISASLTPASWTSFLTVSDGNHTITPVSYYLRDALDFSTTDEKFAPGFLQDTTPPTLNLTPSTTLITNGTITITVDVTDLGSTAARIDYSGADSGTLTSTGGTVSTASFDADRNGTYTVIATDEAGNASIPGMIDVDSIDVLPPSIEFDGMTSGGPLFPTTKENVTVYFVVEDTGEDAYGNATNPSYVGLDRVTVQGGQYATETTLPGGATSFVAEQNGIYRFTAYDNAGNSSYDEVEVDHIDRTLPVVAISHVSPTGVATNGNVTVTFTTSDTGDDGFGHATEPSFVLVDSVTVQGGQYATETALPYGSTTFEAVQNANYRVTVYDMAGNESYTEVLVDNIDRMLPVVTIPLVSPTGAATIGNVTVTFTAADTGDDGFGHAPELSYVGVDKVTVQGGQYATETTLPGGAASFVATQNANYRVTAYDMAGNESYAEVLVDNIDRTAPGLMILPYDTLPTKGNVTVPFNASDLGDDGHGHATDPSYVAVDKITVLGGQFAAETTLPGGAASFIAEQNATYTLKVTDKAGNVTTGSVTITNIDREKARIYWSKTGGEATGGKPAYWMLTVEDNMRLGEVAIINRDTHKIMGVYKLNDENVTEKTIKFTMDEPGSFYAKVTDYAENEAAYTATDVLAADSDGDGLPDAWEISLGTDPNSPDMDNDGLSDGAEVKEHGTDPKNQDTDSDGLRDDLELSLLLNPKLPDSDGDGVSDLIVYLLGYAPTTPSGYLAAMELLMQNALYTSGESPVIFADSAARKDMLEKLQGWNMVKLSGQLPDDKEAVKAARTSEDQLQVVLMDQIRNYGLGIMGDVLVTFEAGRNNYKLTGGLVLSEVLPASQEEHVVRVALPSADGSLVLLANWDTKAGKVIGSLVLADIPNRKFASVSHSENATLFDISPDGSRIAYVAADGKLQMLSLEKGNLDPVYEGSEPPQVLMFGADNRLVTNVTNKKATVLGISGNWEVVDFSGVVPVGQRTNTASKLRVVTPEHDDVEVELGGQLVISNNLYQINFKVGDEDLVKIAPKVWND